MQPQQQLSTIEKSVTHLLVATKQLLETLTMWSRGSAAESEVSDVYVRLGYEFNIACRAFNAIGVDTSDLGPVPDLLRTILEDTLSQEASQASLDRYLPRIRDIIINLLHGLKKKQQRLRQKNGGNASVSSVSSATSASGEARPPRQVSSASTVSMESSLSRELEDVPSRHSSNRTYAQRQGSGEMGAGPELPPRTTSQIVNGGSGRVSPRRQQALSPQNGIHGVGALARESSSGSDLSSSMSSAALQNIPVIAPYPEEDTIPTPAPLPVQPQEPTVYEMPSDEQPPPRPPPKQNDALTALQRGGELERRASRRFSAYQIQKHLGGTAGTMNGLGALPPAQHSPAPNRGREVRESMSAVRSRTSVHGRVRSRHEKGHEASPNRFGTQKRIEEEVSEAPAAMPSPPKPWTQQGGEAGDDDSPMVKTPEDKLGHGSAYPFPGPEERRQSREEDNSIGATLNGPVQDFLPSGAEGADGETPPSPAKTVREHGGKDDGPLVRARSDRRAQRYDTPPTSTYLPTDDSPPQPGKPLTLFLQYKSKIKKYVLDGGELSLARLQLAFIEKFVWNTQNNGADLPEIYIQDPVSGVRYELDGVGDVRDRSVLVLNVEQLDEVKRHIDDGIGGLRRVVEGIKMTVEEQQAVLRVVSERQQEAAREIAGMAVAPKPGVGIASTAPTRSSSNASRAASSASLKDRSSQLDEIRTLRRDLAVVRQTYTSFVSDINASMSTLKTKASSVKKAALDTTVPDISSAESGRAYLNKGKTTLSADSEKIVNRVDDLQDLVEDLRKDVVSRGVRPLPRQLEAVSKDISAATAELKKLQEFLKREKPVWTKIWEKELQVVCDDRDLLTIQEELVVDLEDDLEKAAGIFALVEQATKQQNLRAPNEGDVAEPGKRIPSRGALVPVALGGADPAKARDGVLGEVRALQPNHESRLEAIERAERARQRELESRKGGEFQRELGNFVEEGKLKKSGGVEEVERRRLAREEKTRREVHENMLAREREKEARKAAMAAQQVAQAEGGDADPSQANGDVDGGEGNANLEVPGAEEGRESSPEPSAFVEAGEGLTPEVGTPAEEKSAG